MTAIMDNYDFNASYIESIMEEYRRRLILDGGGCAIPIWGDTREERTGKRTEDVNKHTECLNS